MNISTKDVTVKAKMTIFFLPSFSTNTHVDIYQTSKTTRPQTSFILMNLMLSIQAAYAAPIIMMSQNRQAARDHLEAHNDYVVNKKAEEEIRAILEHNTAQNDALTAIYEKLSNVEAGVAGILPQPSKPMEPTKLNDEK